MSLHLRPVQFVDTPVGRDGEVARLAGGMTWFAAYEVIENGATRTIPIADLDRLIEADERAATLHARITAPRAPMTLGDRTIRFDQPHVAGILNVTPDSFSDGGRLDQNPQAAAEAGFDQIAAGAAIVDIGGESTRPGAATVWEGDEANRVVPVIERLAHGGAGLSIDTRKATVMEAALAAGAHLINDVAALLYDDRAIEVAVAAQCPVVLMHSPDPKQGGHGDGGYANVLTDVFDWLEDRIAAVVAAGVARERILIDPGLGFGKTLAENLALVNGLAMLHGLGCPILFGASRKRMIGALSGEAAADQRLGGSIALAMKALDAGAQVLRVHDVAETVQAIRVWRGCKDQALTGR